MEPGNAGVRCGVAGSAPVCLEDFINECHLCCGQVALCLPDVAVILKACSTVHGSHQ